MATIRDRYVLEIDVKGDGLDRVNTTIGRPGGSSGLLGAKIKLKNTLFANFKGVPRKFFALRAKIRSQKNFRGCKKYF